MYMVYLKDWLNVFPKEQFKVIRFEDYIMEREKYIEDIAEWLGLGTFATIVLYVHSFAWENNQYC